MEYEMRIPNPPFEIDLERKCNKHAVQVYFLTPTAHVDSRILKVVAIENSKDVDAAAEIVLSTAAANKLEQAGFQNIAGELASSIRDDEDDSVAKMKAAEEALEAKQ
ncbi:hypothetical protein Gotur_029605, partial [Gossypium turneri]